MSAYPFDELLPVFVDNTSRETNLAETNVLVHLLSVFSIEWAPSAAHLEKQDTERPKIDEF